MIINAIKDMFGGTTRHVNRLTTANDLASFLYRRIGVRAEEMEIWIDPEVTPIGLWYAEGRRFKVTLPDRYKPQCEEAGFLEVK